MTRGTRFQVITDDKKMPKNLLQASLRPILTSLGSYNKLNLPMLRGLAHLLELLSSWFNITLGASLLAMPRHPSLCVKQHLVACCWVRDLYVIMVPERGIAAGWLQTVARALTDVQH